MGVQREVAAGWLAEVQGPERFASQVSLRVLLVDDDPVVIEQVRALVRQVHPVAEVHLARDLATARAALRSAQPRIVVLDVVLGQGEEGASLAEEVRGNAGIWGVVVHSSLPEEDPRVQRARAAGHVRYLRKPARRRDLAEALQDILARHGGGPDARIAAPHGLCVACGTPLVQSWGSQVFCPAGC